MKRSLRSLLLTTVLTGIVSVSLPPASRADIAVIDRTNLVENILTALREFIQIQNQLVMLTQQQGGIDRFRAQFLIGQAIGTVQRLAVLTDRFGDQPIYDGVYGALPPGQSGIAVSDSWNQPRAIGHATATNTYAVLRQQLLQSQRQMEQVQTNVANSNAQTGVVGSIQAATEMLGTLGDQLNTVQLVNAQQLRLMNAQEAQRLQKQERGLAAYEIQSAPLQVTLPASRLRSLFE